MKKLLFFLAISITIISGCSSLTSSGSSDASNSSGTASSSGSAISRFFTKIPTDLQGEVNNRVDTDSELFGFGTANSEKIGSAAGQMKALDNAKSDLNSKIKKEAQKYLNIHYNSLESYTKTLVKPALSDLVNHTTELASYNITQKGAWEGENKVHSLVTVKKSDIETHAKNVFSTFLDNMSDKISSAKSSI